MHPVLGVLIALSAVAAAVVFGMAWRRRQPGTPWPLHVVASLVGVLVVAVGAFAGSWIVCAGGVVIHLVGRVMGRRARAIPM